MKIIKIVIPVLIILGLILSLRLLGVFEIHPTETSQLPDFTLHNNSAEPQEQKPQTDNNVTTLKNTKIAFISNRDGNDEIYIMNSIVVI